MKNEKGNERCWWEVKCIIIKDTQCTSQFKVFLLGVILKVWWQMLVAITVQVSVLDSPKTSKRFSVSKVPELCLFRDRHMYVYKGELNGPAIKEFVQVIL
jgi:hypothetical protein